MPGHQDKSGNEPDIEIELVVNLYRKEIAHRSQRADQTEEKNRGVDCGKKEAEEEGSIELPETPNLSRPQEGTERRKQMQRQDPQCEVEEEIFRRRLAGKKIETQQDQDPNCRKQ